MPDSLKGVKHFVLPNGTLGEVITGSLDLRAYHIMLAREGYKYNMDYNNGFYVYIALNFPPRYM